MGSTIPVAVARSGSFGARSVVSHRLFKMYIRCWISACFERMGENGWGEDGLTDET
jgi:hypothetical protein